MDGPILITFGVELEFYIRFTPSDYEKAIDELISNKPEWAWIDHRGLLQLALRSHMIDTLKEHQFAVNDIDVTEENYTKWTVARDSTIQPAMDNPEYGNPDFSFEGIELKSPALLHSSDSMQHVSKVISIINQTFKPSVNRSTGFHVHVGNGASGFPLQTLKNFASLVTVFQRQIQSIHAEDRLDNHFCAAPSTIFRQQPPLEVTKHIYAISNLGDLLNIFIADGNRFQAYNFENIRERLKTIEFRQHKGTMEWEEIGHWIHLVCGLICTSHHAGPAGFTDLIIRFATEPNDEDYALPDLLVDLQLDHLVPYYSTRLQRHRRLSHEWHPGLQSPEIAADDEEDDEEPQDDQRPAWKGSPEFDMRPKLAVANPDEAAHEPEEHGPPTHEENSATDLESHNEAQDPQHILQPAWHPWDSEATTGQAWDADTEIQEALQYLQDDSQESEAGPRRLMIANPDEGSDTANVEWEPAEWKDFDWDWREEATKNPSAWAGFDLFELNS